MRASWGLAIGTLLCMFHGGNSWVMSEGANSKHWCAYAVGSPTFVCTGANEFGQLGLGHAMSQNTMQEVDAGGAIQKVLVGRYNTAVIYTDGSLKIWGRGAFGANGQGHPFDLGASGGTLPSQIDPVDLGEYTVIGGAFGAQFFCALLNTNQLKCFGSSNYGQLGYGDTTDRGMTSGTMGTSLPLVNVGSGRTVIQVVAGEHSVCVLLDNRKAKCWGRNNYGQLGQENTDSYGLSGSTTPNLIGAIDLGSSFTPTKLAVGKEAACALNAAGVVKCWGKGTYGRRGVGNTDHIGTGSGQMGDSLEATNLGTGRTAVKVATSASATCAILDNASVKCFGRNLLVGQTLHLSDGSGEVGDAVPYMSLGTDVGNVVDIISGTTHFCVQFATEKIKCWGWNSDGRLGVGHTNNVGDSPDEMGDSLQFVSFPAPACSTRLMVAIDHTYEQKANTRLTEAISILSTVLGEDNISPSDSGLRIGLTSIGPSQIKIKVGLDSSTSADKSSLQSYLSAWPEAALRTRKTRWSSLIRLAQAVRDESVNSAILIISDGQLASRSAHMRMKRNIANIKRMANAPKLLCLNINPVEAERKQWKKRFFAHCDTYWGYRDWGKTKSDIAVEIANSICEPSSKLSNPCTGKGRRACKNQKFTPDGSSVGAFPHCRWKRRSCIVRDRYKTLYEE
mmetsp:Transcript_5604/g.12514  ORF Transcript_5604/g.12514 Transcript_5604/m.12514 type:complete len:676 (-) Transcript_5604:42-2069(-)